MRDGWLKTTLGAVLLPLDSRAGASGVELILSVTEKRGIIPQDQVFKKRIATHDLAKYKVLCPLDIAFNPYLVWAGAVGQWLGDTPGVTSPVYETFRVADTCDPRFMGVVLESGVLTEYFESTAIGSIRRRRRTTLPVFNAAPLLLPPLVEQRRIVDLITAVDESITAAGSLSEAAWSAWFSLARSLIGAASDVARLDSIVEVTMGRQRAPKYAVGDHMVRYLRAANVKDGRLALEDVLEMNFTPAEQATFALRPGDVLVTEGCGSISQLGASARWSVDLAGTVCMQNTLLRLRAIPSLAVPGFIEHLARFAHHSGLWASIASGTNIFHIGSERAKALQVPALSVVEQEAAAEQLQAAEDVRRGAERIVGTLKHLREALLSDLLSGKHEIPESYDELLAGAA